MEEDNWLNEYVITCPSSKHELQICDHSPFENGYYLYCSSCPKRVDISIYDTHFDVAKSNVHAKYPHSTENDKFFLSQLLQKVETMLMPCECGGSFSSHSKQRCLHCSAIIDNLESYQNVWLSNYWSDVENEQKEKMKKFLINPKWK